ncbi:MAG: HAD family hydrolase [Ruminococcus sp.]|nr:HAD family hydrolase [Ruminococcus sp.]
MELFISDLDGTLLNSGAELSDFTRNTLNRLISEKNMNFTVATARTYASAGKILKGLDLKYPVVLMNGVLIYDPQSEKYAVVNKLESKIKAHIISEIRKCGLSAFMYTVSENQMMTYYEELANKQMQDFYDERRKKYYKSFEQTADFGSVNSDVIYFTIIDKKDRLAPLYNFLRDCKGISITYYNDVYSEDMWYLEIFSDKASKRNGVKYLRERYGFDKITAFGDNTNDLPMFEVSDESIVVSNANQAVLSQCDHIIASNEEDGVAKYLDEYFSKITEDD